MWWCSEGGGTYSHVMEHDGVLSRSKSSPRLKNLGHGTSKGGEADWCGRWRIAIDSNLSTRSE